MRRSRAFWLGFGLLCGACLLSVISPCVGVFALVYLVIALVALVAYLVMRARAGMLREGGAEGGRVMLPVKLASFDAALDLWALSAVMGISAAVALVTAGGDVRRWLGGVA